MTDSTSNVIKFPEGWRQRLERSAAYEQETKEAHKLALAARNQLVHEAVDDGFPQTYIARALGVTRPTVTRILADPPPHIAA